MRKLVKAWQAEEDLIAIWGHIAVDSPEAADKVLDRFEERWRLLVDHPLAGPSRDDIAAGIRYLVIGQYLAFYRVEEERVVIVRVLHGKRDVTAEDLG